MASVTFDQFLPEIQPEVPGVPYPVVINAIRNACFDFCRRSLVWNEFQSQKAYTQGTAEYVLTPATGAQIVQVLSLIIDDGRLIPPGSTDETVQARPQWRTQEGLVEWFIQPSPGVVHFVAVPNGSGTFVPQVAYAPARDASSVDASLYDLYLEDIKYGALWKLKSIVGEPWADPAGAAYYADLFNRGIGRAVSERTRNNSRASLRVAPTPFV